MRKNLTLTLITAAFLFHASAQSQISNVPAPQLSTPNLYSIQQNFYSTFKDIDKEELYGEEDENDSYYNQFKRWEWLMESRTYPTGNLPDPSIAFTEFDTYKSKHPEYFGTRSATWTPVGNGMVPSNGGGVGRVNVIRFDPSDPNVVYIGTAGGGVWKTTNFLTVEPISDNIPVTSIADIAIDPTNSDIIYIATGDGYGYEATWQIDDDFWGGVYSAGILKSTDGGKTWNTTGLSYAQSDLNIVQRLVINPANPNILIAATRTGLYRTIDGGQTWTQVNNNHCYDLEFNTGDPNTIYAAGNKDILRSIDGGATWTILKDNLCGTGRISVETSAADPNVIYALCESGSFYRSGDAGATWISKASPSGAASFYGYYDLVLECSDANADYLLAGGLYVAKSTSGGASWQTISNYSCHTCSNYVHADNHELEFLPGSTQTIFSGNDGGFFKSTNLGSSWTDLSNGLVIAQIYRLSSSATNPDIVYSGWQDNGSNRWNGTSYTQVYGADGMETVVDYTNPNTVFIETQYGSIYKSTNGGSSFSFVAPSSGSWLTPYIMDPVDHLKMYAVYSSVYKSTNGGTSWTNIGSNLWGGDYASAIAVAPSNTNYVYASSFGKLKKTSTAASPWTDITLGLPVGSAGINYIAVSDTDPNKLWVAMSGYSPGNKVFRSTDGGTTWTNISGSLPNLPVNTIVHEKASQGRLYIGTDVGVYYIDDNTPDWIYYNDGLPNVMVHELEINYTSNMLVAATYGRGIWQSDLVGTSSAATVSTSALNNNDLCPGQSVSVSFTTTGTFSAGNIFTAKLSDATGSFSNPVSIGSITATGSGTINAVIPATTASGTGYRIRVDASNPATTGTDNGSNISIACPIPSGTNTTGVTANSAQLNWNAIACAVNYNVQYKVSSSSTWTKVATATNSVIINALNPSTSYKWKVRTKCFSNPKVFSIFSSPVTFTTLSAKFLGEAESNQSVLNIFPNPMHSGAAITFSINGNSDVSIALLDLQGKEVMRILDEWMNAGSYQRSINRGFIAPGVYVVRMITNEGTLTQKLVIE